MVAQLVVLVVPDILIEDFRLVVVPIRSLVYNHFHFLHYRGVGRSCWVGRRPRLLFDRIKKIVHCLPVLKAAARGYPATT